MFHQEVTNLMPGVGPTRTAEYRKIWASVNGVQYLPGGSVIDGAKSRDPLNVGYEDVLRAGMLMGKVTASGKYAPAVIGKLTAAVVASSSTTLTVSLATGREIIRRVGTSGSLTLSGPATANGTMHTETVIFTGVTLGESSATVALYATTTYAFVSASFVGAADGSETPVTFVDVEDGVKVSFAGSDYDVQFPRVPVRGGVVETANLINVPSDTTLLAWVKSCLNAAGQYVFADNY